MPLCLCHLWRFRPATVSKPLAGKDEGNIALESTSNTGFASSGRKKEPTVSRLSTTTEAAPVLFKETN